MKKINHEIITQMNELNYSNNSPYTIFNVLEQINTMNQNIYEDIGIILFYSIYETYIMNLNLFRDVDINYDRAGYANAKRLTRISIETYLDLYNYCKDTNYYEILRYNSRDTNQSYSVSNLERVLDYYRVGKSKDNKLHTLTIKKYIMIQDKINIAKNLHIDIDNLEFLVENKDEYNTYVHTNMRNMRFESLEERVISTKKLLRVNVFLLCDALNLIIRHYKLDLYPLGFYEHILGKAQQLINYIKDDNTKVFEDYHSNPWIY